MRRFRRSGIPFQPRPRDVLVFLLQLIVPWIAGCVFHPNGVDLPPSKADMALVVTHDLSKSPITPPDIATPPVVVDMTQLPDLTPLPDMTPTPHYRDAIQSILDARGCTVSSCHQAYAPLVIPSPKTNAQWQQNYMNVMADVSLNCDMGPVSECASSSLLLNKPLATSPITHAGGVKPFLTTDDPDYQLIFIWIEEGAKL